jgi:hypothetical protein
MENGVEKFKVELKDEKYPYIKDTDIDVTRIGHRVDGKMIYISGRLVINENNEKYTYFERVNDFTLKLQNAKFTSTDKGTLVIKYEPNITLYLVEIPSGYRGNVTISFMSGVCNDTTVLQSERGSLGEVKHIFCNIEPNGKAEINYEISGRTGTAGYGRLIDLFGESLSGTIKIENNTIKIMEDEELDKLLD